VSGERAVAPSAPLRACLGLAGIALLALAVRLAGFEKVFVGGGDAVLVVGDPWYHLRLALYAFKHFPGYLTFDPYLNHPHGAFVPWPPLFDWLVAGSARLVGASERGLAAVAALAPPLLATLTLVPVFALARRVGGTACGLGAAALFAVFPASTVVSRVGYGDHHVLVSLLGATLLALQARSFAPLSRAGAAALVAGIALARAGLVATWQGSLTYLGVADAAFVLVAAGLGSRRALALEAASLVASAALAAPLAPPSLRSIGGPFSAIETSWLHVAACAALALFALGARAWAAPAPGPAARLARALAVGALAAAGLVAIPGVLSGWARVAAFLGKGDLWGGANPEQQPLFFFSGGTTWAQVLFGFLGYAVPLLPVYLLWRARRAVEPAPLLLLACWCAGFGALALGQTRFASDLAPAASVGFALLLADAGARVAARLRLPLPLRALPAPALAVLLLALPLWREHGPRLRDTLAFARGAGLGADRALLTPGGTLVRFAERVRAATPETSGFLDADARPEYGILADPSLGHVLHTVARRATPSDNFGAYVAPEGLLTTLRVLLALPEEAALAALRELGVRYVATGWQPAYPAGSLLHRLHEEDGLESETARALARFRLVTEGPAGGLPLAAILAPTAGEEAVPYKLFEVVEGAVLEIETRPGARASASAEIVGGEGRRFTYRARAAADARGVARIRVPYATEPAGPAHALGTWRIRSNGGPRCVQVRERDVREGGVVRVAADATCEDPAPADALRPRSPARRAS
jgi:dolichyl-diphosphooligosaccharide--protein glycosyltransferase